jgi:hypothetical protein
MKNSFSKGSWGCIALDFAGTGRGLKSIQNSERDSGTCTGVPIFHAIISFTPNLTMILTIGTTTTQVYS